MAELSPKSYVLTGDEPLVSVYGWWQTPKGDPFDRIPVTEAMRLQERGLARSCRRGTALQLLKEIWQWDIRGESCKPSPRLIEQFVQGFRRAIAVMESWA